MKEADQRLILPIIKEKLYEIGLERGYFGLFSRNTHSQRANARKNPNFSLKIDRFAGFSQKCSENMQFRRKIETFLLDLGILFIYYERDLIADFSLYFPRFSWSQFDIVLNGHCEV